MWTHLPGAAKVCRNCRGAAVRQNHFAIEVADAMLMGSCVHHPANVEGALKITP